MKKYSYECAEYVKSYDCWNEAIFLGKTSIH